MRNSPYLDRPLHGRMTPHEAYRIASQWGSYMRAGDPGACFYAFPGDDGRPLNENHRQQCLNWIRHCEPAAETDDDRRELRALRTFYLLTECAPCSA